MAQANRPRQDERSAATKSALINAARHLFGERGFHSVTVEEVAHAAGLSKGAAYYYFGKGKTALQIAVEASVKSARTDLTGFPEGIARDLRDPDVRILIEAALQRSRSKPKRPPRG